MVEDSGIGAACLFQRIAEDRQALEVPLLVGPAGDGDHSWGAPGRVEAGRRTEGIADDAPAKVADHGTVGVSQISVRRSQGFRWFENILRDVNGGACGRV